MTKILRLSRKSDPYGANQPSPIPRPSTSGAGQRNNYGRSFPWYLKPIPINTRDTREVLESAINTQSPKLARWLYSTWNAEAEALKYQEIRNAIATGELSQEWIDDWRQRYAQFVNEQLTPTWRDTQAAATQMMAEAAQRGHGVVVERMDQLADRLEEWIGTRAGELIEGLTTEQTSAIRSSLQYLQTVQGISSQETARYLRPLIGLTRAQTAAVARFRESLAGAGLTEAQRLKRVEDYSARLHRLRAQRIADTEIAFAYNYAKQANVEQLDEEGGLSGPVIKRWLTGQDERVCPFCGALGGWVLDEDGTDYREDEQAAARVDLAQTFPGATRRLPNVKVPPAHPSCRCDVIYEVLSDIRSE